MLSQYLLLFAIFVDDKNQYMELTIKKTRLNSIMYIVLFLFFLSSNVLYAQSGDNIIEIIREGIADNDTTSAYKGIIVVRFGKYIVKRLDIHYEEIYSTNRIIIYYSIFVCTEAGIYFVSGVS